MKDPYSGLYEVTEIHNLRDVIKKRLHEFPQNPVFLVHIQGLCDHITWQVFESVVVEVYRACHVFVGHIPKRPRVCSVKYFEHHDYFVLCHRLLHHI